MKVNSLTFNGFRNLKKTTLDFDSDKKIFAFVGPNGHGKTNVLEAIFLLAISKSFRTNNNWDLMEFDADFCSLNAKVDRGDDELIFDLIATREPPKKTLKINGLQKNAADYIGNFNVVFFSPEDIGMVHLSPAIRRRYIDLLLSQFDREYLMDSVNYKQTIKQRNSLLKQISDGKSQEEELEFWDKKLAETGLRIIKKRADVINEINKFSSTFYKDVSGNNDELIIKYDPSIDKCDESRYLEFLVANRKRDILSGSTQLGPHRDDLIFLCNGHDMKSFASRGEWRSLVLTLKFAEIELLKEKTGHYPILLLDDVFSELDEDRQKVLFNILKNTQTFITTTHREFLDVVDGEKKIFEVFDGGVNHGRRE